MKKTTLFVSLLFVAQSFLHAQTEPKTLLNDNTVKSWGIFVSPQLQSTQILGEQTLLAQLRFGILLNHTWSLGASIGHSVFNTAPKIEPLWLNEQGMSFQQVGGFISYTMLRNNAVHLSFPIDFGVVETQVENQYFSPWGGRADDFEYVNFFLEPGMNVELNLNRFIKLYGGASYRLNDAMVFPQNPGFKLNHHMNVQAGMKLGIYDLPKAFKGLKAYLK